MGPPDLISPPGAWWLLILPAIWVGSARARKHPWSVVFWLPAMLMFSWVAALGIYDATQAGGGPWAGIGALICIGVSFVAVLLGALFWMVRPAREAWRWPWVVGVLALCAVGAWRVNEHEKVPVRIRIVDGDGRPIAGATVEMSFGGNLKQTWRSDAEGVVGGWWRPRSTVFMQVKGDRHHVSSPTARSWVRLEWQADEGGYRVERTWNRLIGGTALYETVRERIPAGRLTELRLVVPRRGELDTGALRENPALVAGGACEGIWMERLERLPAKDMAEATAREAARLLGSLGTGLTAREKAGEMAVSGAEWSTRWQTMAEGCIGWALDDTNAEPRRLQILAELGPRLSAQGEEIVRRLAVWPLDTPTRRRGVVNCGNALAQIGLTDAQLGRLLDTGRAEWMVAVGDARRNRLSGPLGARLARELAAARPGITDPELARRADSLLAELKRDAEWRSKHPQAN